MGEDRAASRGGGRYRCGGSRRRRRRGGSASDDDCGCDYIHRKTCDDDHRNIDDYDGCAHHDCPAGHDGSSDDCPAGHDGASGHESSSHRSTYDCDGVVCELRRGEGRRESSSPARSAGL